MMCAWELAGLLPCREFSFSSSSALSQFPSRQKGRGGGGERQLRTGRNLGSPAYAGFPPHGKAVVEPADALPSSSVIPRALELLRPRQKASVKKGALHWHVGPAR